LPIPPAPRIAILAAGCWLSILIMLSTSDLRPWKILGLEGNSENEFELERIIKKR
jgi:hypothetical protein